MISDDCERCAMVRSAGAGEFCVFCAEKNSSVAGGRLAVRSTERVFGRPLVMGIHFNRVLTDDEFERIHELLDDAINKKGIGV